MYGFKDPSVRLDTEKLLEENIGRTVFIINCSKIFFDPPPRVMKIKTKINKWDLVKLKSFCTAKESINKVKKQPLKWEKIFSNEATDKGLIPQIYKQPMQHNIKKQKNPIQKQTYKKKMGSRSKETFLQRRHTKAQQIRVRMFSIKNY